MREKFRFFLILVVCSYFPKTTLAAKARVNVLFFSTNFNWLIASASTYNGSGNVGRPFSSDAAPDYSGEPWMANHHLQNVDMYYMVRNTRYSDSWNPLNTVRLLLADYGVLASSTEMQKRTHVHMIAGPIYSGEAKGLAQVTTLFNTIIISGEATSPDLSDKKRYPTFFRTVPSDGDGPVVVIQKFREMHYDKVTTMLFSDDFIMDFADLFGKTLIEEGMIEENRFILYDSDDKAHPYWANYFSTAANGLKKADSHVWLAVIGANAYQNYQLLCALYKAGVTGDQYQGFFFGSPTDDDWWYNAYSLDLLYNASCTRAQIEAALGGALIITQAAGFDKTPADYINLTQDDFLTKFSAEMVRSQRPIADVGGFYIFDYYLMDALTTCALALDYVQGKMMQNDQMTLDPVNAPAARNFTYTGQYDSLLVNYTIEFLEKTNFHGLTGPVSFNVTSGDRVARLFSAYQLQHAGGLNVTRTAKIIATGEGITIQPDEPEVYPTEDGKPPPQSIKPSLVVPIALGIAGGIILLAAIPLAVWLIRRHLAKIALQAAVANASNWLISPQSLKSGRSVGGISRFSLNSSTMSGTNNRDNKALSLNSMSTFRTNDDDKKLSSFATRPYSTFMYNQNLVCAFALRRREHALDQEIVKQMMTVQACASDSTARFVGISVLLTRKVADPSMHYILAGSNKGSLADFFEEYAAANDDDNRIDDVFAFSLIHDLHTGLHEIHRITAFHGRLSSTVCMVDNRMSLRVSDYGFSRYRLPAFYDVVANANHDELWLWCAPEVLRQILAAVLNTMWPSSSGSPLAQQYPNLMPAEWSMADIYSYGVICSEIFTVNRPFATAIDAANCSTTDFLRRVSEEPLLPSDMIRSAIQSDKLTLAADISDMILKCVAGEPTARPALSDIGNSLRAMVKTRKLSSNITEMLMQQLESYAKNLEGIVAQRTEALAVEQKKVTKLLHQILPPSVADALKNGEIVPPKEYDSVTIYFSDVVGFTTISAASTPFQIVDLLNDLYNAFDNILSTFDVYKVETIGDAYMVVSGLPKPNGHQHVRNIGLMSLALITHVTTAFCIRHRPDEQLRLRIGMHSGSCAAGVVGFVMPRYCLFGDAVNTASRMESNGEALRIHVSEASAKLIQEQGFADGSANADFVLTPRGEIEVKGKGIMKTFWMTKPGKPMPENVAAPVAGHHH